MPIEALSDDRLTAAAAKLPAAPRIFQQLSAAIRDPDVSVEAMVTVVRLDPVLSARVIRASNSPMFSRGGNIVSLDGAIERIGIYEVFQLVGAAMASQLYSGGLPVYGISGDQLWENSVTTAVALDHLAEDGRRGWPCGVHPGIAATGRTAAASADCLGTNLRSLDWTSCDIGASGGVGTGGAGGDKHRGDQPGVSVVGLSPDAHGSDSLSVSPRCGSRTGKDDRAAPLCFMDRHGPWKRPGDRAGCMGLQ
jgi:hypothetical protein